MDRQIKPNDIHEIVKILIEDPELAETRDIFFMALKLPRHDLVDLKRTCRADGSGTKEFLNSTIQLWISRKGTGATFGNLVQILENEDFINLAGSLNEALDSKMFSPAEELMGEARNNDPPRRFCFEIPEKILHFAGRELELSDLHNSVMNNLDGAVITTVSGMGGIGKTTLAVKYIWKYHMEYFPNVIWINAEDSRSLTGSFLRLATKLGFVESSKQDLTSEEMKNILKEVYNKFTSNSLFVFDNVEGYEEIRAYLPPNSDLHARPPRLIITSRNNKWNDKFKSIILDVFTEEEALTFFKEYLGLGGSQELKTASEICKILQYLPIAVRQASAYIKAEKEESIPRKEYNAIMNEYTSQFNTEDCRDLLDYKYCSQTGEEGNVKTTFITWNITLNRIKKRNEFSERIMEFISYLSPDRIPILYLRTLQESVSRDRESLMWKLEENHCLTCNTQMVSKEESLKSAINLLSQYSLIKIENEYIGVHRLVQKVIREQNRSREESLLTSSLEIMHNYFHSQYREHLISVWIFALEHDNPAKLFPHIGIVACRYITYSSMRSKDYKFALRQMQRTMDKFKVLHPTETVYQMAVKCYELFVLCRSNDPNLPLVSTLVQEISKNWQVFAHSKGDFVLNVLHCGSCLHRIVEWEEGDENSKWNMVNEFYKTSLNVITSRDGHNALSRTRIAATQRNFIKATIDLNKTPKACTFTCGVLESFGKLKYKGDGMDYLFILKCLAQNLIANESIRSNVKHDDLIQYSMVLNEDFYKIVTTRINQSKDDYFVNSAMLHKAKCLLLLGGASNNEEGVKICDGIVENFRGRLESQNSFEMLFTVSKMCVESGYVERGLQYFKLFKGRYNKFYLNFKRVEYDDLRNCRRDLMRGRNEEGFDNPIEEISKIKTREESIEILDEVIEFLDDNKL